MTDAPKAKIDWGKLSSDSDGDESEPELEVVVPVVGEQPAVQSKETNEAVPEPQHKGEKGHPNIVPFKESKHIRPKMKIKGGFRPEKLEKKKNTIRKAVNPFDIGGNSDSDDEVHEASSEGEQQASGDEQTEEKPETTEQQTEQTEVVEEKPKQQPVRVFKPKEKKKKDEAQLKEEAELNAMFDFIEGKGPKPKAKEGEAEANEKKEAVEATTAEGKQEAKKKKKKKKEGKAEVKAEEKPAVTTETKPAEAPAVQQPTISIEELMKKKAKETKATTGGKKKGVNVDVAKKELEERAAKAKAKKVHEDL